MSSKQSKGVPDEAALELPKPPPAAAPSRKASRSSLDPRLVSLAKEVVEEHHAVQESLATTLLHAMKAGRALRAMQGYVGHGEWTNFVEEHFCRPHGLSIRTAQRYMKLASGYAVLVDALKSERADAALSGDANDEKLLAGVPINRALHLIRSAVSAQENSSCLSIAASSPGPNEWWTPADIVARVEKLFGVIDLDPCACSTSDPVPAKSRIVLPEDGLAEASVWTGKALINPGFKTEHSGWVRKAVSSFQARTLTEAILLLPVETNSDWAQSISTFPHAFFRTPIAVDGPNRTAKLRIGTPAMLVYVGATERFATFAETFRDMLDAFLPV